MKTIINLLAGIFFLINTGFASEINYKLNLTNINITSEKTLEFDIYLMNSGENKEEFRYAMGQYFLDINPGLTNSGELTCSIVKSDLPESMRPANVSVSGNQLRLSVNQFNSDVKSLPVVTNEGLLIARVKLETSSNLFSKKEFDIKWSGAESSFRTKIATFSDGQLVEITAVKNHFVELDNSVSGADPNGIEIPAEYSLSQNYPNPFNPTTLIHYSLSNNGFTSLKVYDIAGKEIATLVSERQNAGRYEVSFNGFNFASGVYFYKITAGEFKQVRRMILIK